MPETPAISAWRSIGSVPLLPRLANSGSKRHHGAISGGRFDGGLENGDVVDEVFPADGIGRLATNRTGEGNEIVLDGFGRGNFRNGDRAAGHGRGDDPAGRRFDMRLVPNFDPAPRAENRETRDE